MAIRAFFDSNVLLYSFSTEQDKTSITEQLLNARGLVSVQVLNEVAAVARRKLRLSWADIIEGLQIIQNHCAVPAPLTLSTHQTALRLAQRYGYTIYDSLLLASALEQGCDTFYSEDMQDGHSVEGLSIRNPFRKLQ